MKAFAYCRVSTQGQSDEGISLDMQRTRIAAFCVANGYELAGIFVETASGAKMTNRPELRRALDETCRARGVIVVYSLSRLARSLKDAITMMERLDRASANLASLNEYIDTSSAVGRMLLRLLLNLAQFEREQLAERTTAAMAHLRRASVRISGRIPLGYDCSADGSRLVENAAEQQVIGRIVECRARGETLSGIARRLAGEGIPTKEGGRWDHATVRSILVRREKLLR